MNLMTKQPNLYSLLVILLPEIIKYYNYAIGKDRINLAYSSLVPVYYTLEKRTGKIIQPSIHEISTVCIYYHVILNHASRYVC